MSDIIQQQQQQQHLQQFKSWKYYKVQQFDLPLKNPYKNVSALETNCAMKAGISFVAGGGMGLLMGLFMNAMETGRQFDMVGVKQPNTRLVLRKDARKILGQARGFALFGFFFSVFECNISHLRQTDDFWNDFWACGLTSLVLAIGNVTTYKGFATTFLFGGAFGGVMYHFNLFGG